MSRGVVSCYKNKGVYFLKCPDAKYVGPNRSEQSCTASCPWSSCHFRPQRSSVFKWLPGHGSSLPASCPFQAYIETYLPIRHSFNIFANLMQSGNGWPLMHVHFFPHQKQIAFYCRRGFRSWSWHRPCQLGFQPHLADICCCHPAHPLLKAGLTSQSRKLNINPYYLWTPPGSDSVCAKQYITDFLFLFLCWASHQPVKEIPFKSLSDIM